MRILFACHLQQIWRLRLGEDDKEIHTLKTISLFSDFQQCLEGEKKKLSVFFFSSFINIFSSLLSAVDQHYPDKYGVRCYGRSRVCFCYIFWKQSRENIYKRCFTMGWWEGKNGVEKGREKWCMFRILDAKTICIRVDKKIQSDWEVKNYVT